MGESGRGARRQGREAVGRNAGVSGKKQNRRRPRRCAAGFLSDQEAERYAPSRPPQREAATGRGAIHRLGRPRLPEPVPKDDFFGGLPGGGRLLLFLQLLGEVLEPSIHLCRRSWARRALLRPRPEAKPPRPSAATTRWQGTRMGTGFRCMACPAARAARGLSARAASQP